MKSCQFNRITKRSTRSTPIDDLDAPPSLASITDMLVGDGDLFWHHKIRRVLATAGFATDRIEREDCHPVWKLKTTRKTFALAPDTETSTAQLRALLMQGGIRLNREGFTILDRRKDALRCVFMFNYGSPGVWLAPPRQTKRQRELWPASL